MESLADIVLKGENLRTVILLVVIIGGFLLQNAKIDRRFVEVYAKMEKGFAELRGEIAELRGGIAAVESRLNSRIDMLKNNDIAHLNTAFKNLTYVLEKKHLIDAEDKAFIDEPLAD